MTERLATLVIGSGFGGSVIAHRLSEAGEKVTLLERGPWRDTGPVREAGIEPRRPLPRGRHFYRHALCRFNAPWLPRDGLRPSRHGLYDIHYHPAMSLICSSGVGGGSHVYTAMNTRPARADYWDGHVEDIRAEDMADHYDWMLEVMRARAPAPGTGIPNFVGDDFDGHPHFTTEGVEQPPMGFDFERARFRDNAYFGSANGEKLTLDRLLLLPAMRKGVDLRAEQEVLDIATTGEPVHRFRVHLYDHLARRHRYLLAENVILAAGTLNTLRLLFASRERGGLGPMPALGRGFSGNGDQAGLWWLNQDRDLTGGAPAQGRFELAGYPDCPNLTRFGLNGIDGIPVPGSLRRKLARQAVVVAMGEDNANGRLSWHRGRLRVDYSRPDNPVLGHINRTLDEIGRRSGARVFYSGKRPLTVHPLGGARLGGTPDNGVVDSHGRVFGHPGLYVADASALPAAPGSPPSMTIAAWAAHVADRFTQTGDSP